MFKPTLKINISVKITSQTMHAYIQR